MTLTEQEKKLFEALNKSQQGKSLVEYVERLCVELFNPMEVTAENINSRKDTIDILKRDIIDRIRLITPEKKTGGKKNQFT